MSLMFCLLVGVCGYRKCWRGPLHQLHKTEYLVALRTGHAHSIVSIYGPTAVSTIGKTVIDSTAAVYCSVTPHGLDYIVEVALRRFFQFYYQRTWTLVINATVVERGGGSPFECFLELFWAPVVLYRWENISETMMFYPLDNTCCFTSVVAFNSRVLVDICICRGSFHWEMILSQGCTGIIMFAGALDVPVRRRRPS